MRLRDQRNRRWFYVQAIIGVLVVFLIVHVYFPEVQETITAKLPVTATEPQVQVIPQAQDPALPDVDDLDEDGPVSGAEPAVEYPMYEIDEEYAQDSDEDFIQKFPEKTIMGDDDVDELAALCNKGDRKWNPHMIIECPTLEGGFGNIRLSILHCLRYVIEAKGSLIVPDISRRNNKNILQFQTTDRVALEHLLDKDHFVNSLKKSCPELVIRSPHFNAPNLRQRSLCPIADFRLESFIPPRADIIYGVPKRAQEWLPAFDEWLLSGGPAPSAESQVHIQLRDLMFSWPTAHDSPGFVRHFGELVRPRADTYAIAAAALRRMRQQFGVDINFPRVDAPSRENAFIGVHLRVEKDAAAYFHTSYELQSQYLLDRLRERVGNSTHPPVMDLPDPSRTAVFIATGETEGAVRLAGDLAPIPAVTKFDLLPDDTFIGTSLRNMTWDQQSLVDLLILERSGYMFGSRVSSFSWYLALRRAAAINSVVGGFPVDCWLGDENEVAAQTRRSGCQPMLVGNERWRDALTTLVGAETTVIMPLWAKAVWP